MRRITLLVLIAMLVTLSCSHALEGPGEPSVEQKALTYCGADTQSFVIQGSGLSPMVVEGATDDPRLEMPQVCLLRVKDADGNPVPPEPEICLADEDVEWVSQNEIRFTATSSLGLSPGEYEVVVKNPDGTKAKGTVTLIVLSDGPLVFWADPSVVYNGISTQITVYGANLGVVNQVLLINSDTGEEIPLDFTQAGTKQNRIQAVVPQGLAVGTYHIRVTSENGCAADLLRGLKITDTIGLTVTTIDPSFGWADGPTPVTITGAGFQQVPRAYLNPDQPAPDTVASSIESVAFASDARLTGVVPQGLPPGLYDLIVVNPDGNVGLLENAFTVTAEPPPVVNNISPNYLDNDGDKTVTIEGENFRDPTVSMVCRAPDGTETTLTGTVLPGGTGTSFQATLPVGGLTQGTVCVVRVTNSDGSYFDYSAIGISNPASNLNDFSTGPTLITARRAPSVAAGRATSAARYVYAIGGDDGSAAGALSSVETVAIDIFGEPSAVGWFEQPVALPEARTMAGIARVGRYLYLVGGNDGTGATASVRRAQVLDPLAAPKIVDVAARKGDPAVTEGIGAGVWYYRVSAVMADDDPSNPGGETLPSEPLVVNLAQEIEGTLVLTLIWEPIAGAKAYRIYRSPTGDLPVGSELRLAEVAEPATSYEDVAPPGPISGPPPLPLGATGVWMGLPDLGTAREAAGVAVARDPVAADQWHLYAIGGRDGGDLATWERLTITVAADGSHGVGTWAAGGANISAARAELSAFSVSHAEAAQVPAGTTYVYAGGGTGSNNVDVAEVAAGGDLVWSAVDAMPPGRAGYAGLAGAGFLFVFGGAQGGPSDSCASGEIDPGAPPQIVNWNNEGVKLNVPRYFAGSAEESAFIFVVGGATSGGAPSATMERTVL